MPFNQDLTTLNTRPPSVSTFKLLPHEIVLGNCLHTWECCWQAHTELHLCLNFYIRPVSRLVLTRTISRHRGSLFSFPTLLHPLFLAKQVELPTPSISPQTGLGGAQTFTTKDHFDWLKYDSSSWLTTLGFNTVFISGWEKNVLIVITTIAHKSDANTNMQSCGKSKGWLPQQLGCVHLQCESTCFTMCAFKSHTPGYTRAITHGCCSTGMFSWFFLVEKFIPNIFDCACLHLTSSRSLNLWPDDLHLLYTIPRALVDIRTLLISL